MTPFLQLAFILAIIIFSAKFAGYLSTRVGQPSVFGELLVGLLLGPSLLNLIHLPFITDTHLGEVIHELAEIGVLLLMFLAGTELNLGDLVRNSRVSALAGTLGVIVPVALGYAVGRVFGLAPQYSLFLGLTLGATSVSISAQTLMELGVLRSRVGLALLGAAVFDDIIVILLLSTATAVMVSQGLSGLALVTIVGRMLAFMVGGLAVGMWLLPRLVRQTARLHISQGLVALALVVMLIYAMAAELIGGMAAITGTFLAGLMFGRTPEKHRIEAGLASIAYGMFVPIFFVNIGLQINIRDLPLNTLWFMLAIIVVAIFGKIAGSGFGARVSKFTTIESLQLGIGMVSRGEVGLIVAAVGMQFGLLTPDLFSSIVAMVLVTTLVTPPLLRFSFAMKPSRKDPVKESYLPPTNTEVE